MALHSLNFKIIRLVGGLLLATTIAILLAVWFALNNHASKQLDENLMVGKNVLNQILLDRERQLYNSAQVLTSDFGFKQAVASDDKATIESVLDNHGRRISADLMGLLSLDGKPVATGNITLKENQLPSSLAMQKIVQQSGGSLFLLVEERLFQCILLTVNAPKPIAIALIGFELDQSFVNDLSAITNLDVTIFQHPLINTNTNTNLNPDGEQQLKPGTSVKPKLKSEDILSDSNLKLIVSSIQKDANLSSNQYDRNLSDYPDLKSYLQSETSSTSVLIESNEAVQIRIFLSENIQRMFSEFKVLQINIALITSVAILVALILGAIFSRGLSKPMRDFVETTKKIAKGNYRESVNRYHSTHEISNLAIAINSMQSGIQSRQKKIEFQAQHDLVSGLYNRFKINEIIQNKLDIDKVFLLVGIVLTNFKEINQAFGFSAGDECLKLFSERLKSMGGSSGRLDSGELIWLPDDTFDSATIENSKRRLLEPFVIGSSRIEPAVAIGLVSAMEKDTSVESLMKKLSLTLEAAKQERAKIHSYEPILETVFQRRVDILHELEASLAKHLDELTVHYQPKLNLKKKQVLKLEALLRWTNPRLGFVSPEEFIPIAENAGLIGQITLHVIARVIQDIKAWSNSGVEMTVAINLSAQDIKNTQVLQLVCDSLEIEKLPRRCLTFEITENELVQEGSRAIESMHAFAENDFELSIDDFGTGYSSLAYLKNLPVKEVKIDKSFVLKLDSEKNDRDIVRAIIALAKDFDLETVAEGVENLAALKLLDSWDCDWIQGYYISKPMPGEQVLAWLLAFQSRDYMAED